jgi:hypothetical protein
VCLGEHGKILFIVVATNIAEKCVTLSSGDVHSENLNVLVAGHKTF